MSKNSKICPACGKKMKQQFIGLQHCKCGISWEKGIGYFERTLNTVFSLERKQVGEKVTKQIKIEYR